MKTVKKCFALLGCTLCTVYFLGASAYADIAGFPPKPDGGGKETVAVILVVTVLIIAVGILIYGLRKKRNG